METYTISKSTSIFKTQAVFTSVSAESRSKKTRNKTGFCSRLTVDALHFVTAGPGLARGRLNDPQSLARLTCQLDTGRCRLAHTPETNTQLVYYMTVGYTCADSQPLLQTVTILFLKLVLMIDSVWLHSGTK